LFNFPKRSIPWEKSTIFLFLPSTVWAEYVLVRTTTGCVITHDGFPLSAGKRFVLNAKAQDYAVFGNVVIPKPVCAFWREVNDIFLFAHTASNWD